jgi:anti-anti-sigma factor
MQIRRSDSKETVFHLQGRMTFQDNDAFREVMIDVTRGKDRTIVLDLGGLDYMDSFAIGLFLVARDESAKGGNHLEFHNPRGAVLRVFQLAELDAVLGDHPKPVARIEPVRSGGLSVSTVRERAPGHAEVALAGRFTLADHGPFDQLLKSLSIGRYKTVDLILERLEFMDSAGLSMLMIARDELVANKGEMRLLAPVGAVARLLSLADIDSVMPVLKQSA